MFGVYHRFHPKILSDLKDIGKSIILTKDFTRNIVHQVKGNYKKSLSV